MMKFARFCAFFILFAPFSRVYASEGFITASVPDGNQALAAEPKADEPKSEEQKKEQSVEAAKSEEAKPVEKKEEAVPVPATDLKAEEQKPEENKAAQPADEPISAEEERKSIAKVIDEKIAPRILTPAVLVDEKTEPSAQLQEENKKVEAQQLKVESQQTMAEKEPLVDEVKGVPSTLDTTSVDAGGNWVKKRAYWEKAEEIIQKISVVNRSIHEQQLKFIKAQTEADDQLDKSFRDIGFEQGQFADLVERLLEEIKQQQENQGDLPEAKRQLEKTLKDKQRELEDEKKALQEIDELDNKLDEAIAKVHEQVQICSGLGKDALDNFLAMGRELNDQKARDMYYKIEGFLATIEKNSLYLSQELWNYFDSTAAAIKQKVGEIGTKIAEMRKKGVDLSKELARLEKEKLEKQQAEIKAEREKIDNDRTELEMKKQVPPPMPTRWTRAQEFFGHAWNYAKDFTIKAGEYGISWCAPVWNYAKNTVVQAWGFAQKYGAGGFAWVKQLFGFNEVPPVASDSQPAPAAQPATVA